MSRQELNAASSVHSRTHSTTLPPIINQPNIQPTIITSIRSIHDRHRHSLRPFLSTYHRRSFFQLNENSTTIALFDNRASSRFIFSPKRRYFPQRPNRGTRLITSYCHPINSAYQHTSGRLQLQHSNQATPVTLGARILFGRLHLGAPDTFPTSTRRGQAP